MFKHTFSQGWLEGIQGGNMFHGFIMGAVSKAGGTLIDSNIRSLGEYGEIVANSILSGTIDEIGGGKFANGAITGAFSVLFNDMMHPQNDKNKKEINIEQESDDDNQNLAAIFASAGVAMVADDVSGIGVVDDIFAAAAFVGAACIECYNLIKNISKDNKESIILSYKEHTSKARPSTKNKHQVGKTRKQRDKTGGEKGDKRRKKYK